jgi:hypothetical protein
MNKQAEKTHARGGEIENIERDKMTHASSFSNKFTFLAHVRNHTTMKTLLPFAQKHINSFLIRERRENTPRRKRSRLVCDDGRAEGGACAGLGQQHKSQSPSHDTRREPNATFNQWSNEQKKAAQRPNNAQFASSK